MRRSPSLMATNLSTSSQIPWETVFVGNDPWGRPVMAVYILGSFAGYRRFRRPRPSRRERRERRLQ